MRSSCSTNFFGDVMRVKLQHKRNGIIYTSWVNEKMLSDIIELYIALGYEILD